MEDLGNTGKCLKKKSHLCSYHPRTSTIIIFVFPSKKKILKKTLMGNHTEGLWKLKMGYLKYQNATTNGKQKSRNTLKHQQEQRV